MLGLSTTRWPCLLSFILLLSSFTSPTSLAYSCHKKEAAALLDIKRSFGSPPFFAFWDPTTDCCTWGGVGCDIKTGHVMALYMDVGSTNVSGPISPSLTRLSYLRSLLISANATGTIPPSLGKLTALTSLHIMNNPHLTGTIPKSLCNLQNLKSLYLSGNDLYGAIPNCFGKSLAMIDLSQNRLSGQIPANIMSRVVTASSDYSRLALAKNQLTGLIPRSLGDVPLKSIDLSENQLTGDASFLFREKARLEDINLSGNELGFDLSKVDFPLQLQELNLSHNGIYGRIPRQISRLRRLRRLDLSYNQLCGPIPTEGNNMKYFAAWSFEHNKCLCGGPLQPCH